MYLHLRTLCVTALTASAVVPACSASSRDDDRDESHDAYSIEGTCDGLPRVKNLETPPGVCVGLVANGFNFTRGIAQLENGDLVVVEMGGWQVNQGGAWLLRRNTDKTFAKTRLLSQIDKPSGIAVGPDKRPYIGTPRNVFRFDPYETVPAKGPLPAEVRQPRLTVAIDNLPSNGRHPLKKLAFDGREPWSVYVNVGSATDVCEQGTTPPPAGYPMPCAEAEGDAARGAIRKYSLNGGDHTENGYTTIARGLRNSMALAVHPTSNLLIQGENSRDYIHKADASLTEYEGNLPHEELNVIEQGASYGWPYCIDNGIPNPEYRGRVDCTHYKNPALLLPGHVAPLGMAFYTGKLFPEAYRNNLLVAYHGYRENGHRLVVVPVTADGVPGVGEPLDVIRGWEASADGADAMGSPVDVIVAKDGSIYLTEDKNGDVLRVFFDSSVGNGTPLAPVVSPHVPVNADESARCAALAQDTSPFAAIERDVIDTACINCHGAGPGYPGNLALYKCDAAGNAARLLKPRADGVPAYVVPRDENSELVLRLKGEGFPQMPAGGVREEQLDAVLAWIRSGAPTAP